ncbi:hypothetical protein Pla175_39070 [Pirellulimonas nuda]|uniref:Uncharacterized protein n=1 Tax=Pirellulimonas nuda TaxID=2528009 RepID=A0A518DGD6_9BACT|nr:hypothetical protein [Pirellulimonas nuda]QDU90502.1 hypothetical protein Pla175_39070 [Pirellulimonas nuda]
MSSANKSDSPAPEVATSVTEGGDSTTTSIVTATATSPVLNPGSVPEALELPEKVDTAGAGFLETLRLSQDFTQTGGTYEILSKVPLQKPNKHWFVRVNPDPAWMMEVLLFEDESLGEKALYVVDRRVAHLLEDECIRGYVFLGITSQGVCFAWPAKGYADDGSINQWHESALKAVGTAREQWVRVRAHKPTNSYKLIGSRKVLPDPAWPQLTPEELFGLALKDHVIDREDHPAIQRLMGEA